MKNFVIRAAGTAGTITANKLARVRPARAAHYDRRSRQRPRRPARSRSV